MPRFYLSGERTFGNRGCEAIVRSTVTMIRDRLPDSRFDVPSEAVNLDLRQWPSAPDSGVQFVPEYNPWWARYWVHLQRLPLRALKRAGWPGVMPNELTRTLEQADVVLSVGGDQYSLDYRLPSLLVGIDAAALQLDRPVILWGASVGPFEREPLFVPRIRDHLSALHAVAVREQWSYDYLTTQLGLSNVVRVADPAFTLEIEELDCGGFWPDDAPNGVVGLNISPLLERFVDGKVDLVSETTRFVRSLVNEREYSVLLAPHVMPLSGSGWNDDAAYMQRILDACSDLGGRVRMLPRYLNAPQIKAAIAKTRFFIGARTHATIAALSSGVPTASIGYSVKARGINRDVFGHEEALIPSDELSANRLLASLEWLERTESAVLVTLKERLPDVRRMSRKGVELVINALS